jgi:1-acyl-sn-glycerol-3-phosphate acyltransferase
LLSGWRRLRFLYLGVLYEVLGRLMPGILRRGMRRGLAGIWSSHEGEVPAGGAVVVANHHSWWDVHFAIAISAHHRRPSGGVMDDAQLAAFPFFRRLGIVGRKEVRQAVRLAQRGHHVVVYVEGALRPPGPLGAVQPGAAAIARWAEVPLIPCAIRVVMRGRDRPEAYLRVGAALPPGTPTEGVAAALAETLGRLDADVAAAPDAEVPVPGYSPWWPQRPREHERIARWRRFWGAA